MKDRGASLSHSVATVKQTRIGVLRARRLISLARRSEPARVPLIADLEIPAVRIAEVEALELAIHVGLWVQTAFFEFGLHFGSVPGLDTSTVGCQHD